MRKLVRSDIVSIGEYEKTRDQTRQQVLAHKSVRRLLLGDNVVITFETRETMSYQVQEMMRAEKITAEDAIHRELEVYNELVPAKHQLSATLFVTVTTDAEMREWLPKLVAIDEHVLLSFAGKQVRARSEPGRNREDKTASVHYIWFDFTDEEAAAFRNAERAEFVCDHPNYLVSMPLTRDTLVALRDDLARE